MAALLFAAGAAFGLWLVFVVLVWSLVYIAAEDDKENGRYE